jgi:hypothetical protein
LIGTKARNAMLSVKAITAGRVFALSMMVGIKSFQPAMKAYPTLHSLCADLRRTR